VSSVNVVSSTAHRSSMAISPTDHMTLNISGPKTWISFPNNEGRLEKTVWNGSGDGLDATVKYNMSNERKICHSEWRTRKKPCASGVPHAAVILYLKSRCKRTFGLIKE
jgi:hypothetical protein